MGDDLAWGMIWHGTPAYPYAAALSSTSPRTHAPEANSENQMKNSHSPNQGKQASEPALSSSDVDVRQNQDTLERQQDSALEESQRSRVDSSSESEDTAQSRCDEDRANRIIADASSYELAIETIQSEIVRERSRMHAVANPTDRDSAVPKEATITNSTSNSRGQTRSEGTANADITAPAPTTVNSQKTRSTSRRAVPLPPKQKNKISRPRRTPKTT